MNSPFLSFVKNKIKTLCIFPYWYFFSLILMSKCIFNVHRSIEENIGDKAKTNGALPYLLRMGWNQSSILRDQV